VSALQAAASIIAALAIIGGALCWAWRQARPLLQMADDWRGEPERKGPGGTVVTDARPSVMERLKLLETQVCEMHTEMHPNGGGSFRDVADRIEKRVAAIESRIP
jgi:hypothetical protein